MAKKRVFAAVWAGLTTLALVPGCADNPDASTSQTGPGSSAPGGKDKYAVVFASEAVPGGTEIESPLGRIVGAVKWNGTPPIPDRIPVSRDGHACAEHGRHDRPSDFLVVNPENGGVKDSIISLVGQFDAGELLSEMTYPDTLNQRQCSYEPRVFVVPLNARISVTSDDDVGHNVRMQGAAELNIAISKGGRSSRRFDRAGVVKLGCDIHPWMTGYIHVVKHRHHGVTDRDGRFELSNVPPGTHQIRLWHEAWWRDGDEFADPISVTHSVTVRPGETTQVSYEFSDPTSKPSTVEKSPFRSRS